MALKRFSDNASGTISIGKFDTDKGRVKRQTCYANVSSEELLRKK